MTEPRDNHAVLHTDLEPIYSDITELKTGQSSLKTAMTSLAASNDRIERKMDSPKPGPTWVAIGTMSLGLATAVCALFLSILSLTAGPIRAGLVAEATNRKETDMEIVGMIGSTNASLVGLVKATEKMLSDQSRERHEQQQEQFMYNLAQADELREACVRKDDPDYMILMNKVNKIIQDNVTK